MKVYLAFCMTALICLSAFAAEGDEVSSALKKQATADIQVYFDAFKKGDYALLKKSASPKYLKDYGPEAALRKTLEAAKGGAIGSAYEITRVTEGEKKNEIFVMCVQKNSESVVTQKRLIKMVKIGKHFLVDELRGTGDI
jgi:hypothetical protein